VAVVTTEVKSVKLNLKLEPSVYEELSRRAKVAERTVAAEIRLALKHHVAQAAA
jgi:hypothetical protein